MTNTVELFASNVLNAAKNNPVGSFGNNKVLISHIKSNPVFVDMTTESFNSMMILANKECLISLCEIQSKYVKVLGIDPSDLKSSEIQHLNSQVHCVCLAA